MENTARRELTDGASRNKGGHSVARSSEPARPEKIDNFILSGTCSPLHLIAANPTVYGVWVKRGFAVAQVLFRNVGRVLGVQSGRLHRHCGKSPHKQMQRINCGRQVNGRNAQFMFPASTPAIRSPLTAGCSTHQPREFHHSSWRARRPVHQHLLEYLLGIST